ncbi:hypothetical protein BH11VER1_BH11VER1_11000 [soil metagenome]
MMSLTHLPGGELIAKGLKDSAEGLVTPAACLISIGWPRLERAGMNLQSRNFNRITAPESELYQLLGSEHGDPYSRYNALIRQLISFEQSLESELARHPSLKP